MPDSADPISVLQDEGKAALSVGADGRPGWKTTEFWTHLGGLVFACAVGWYGASHDSNMLVAMATALVGTSNVGYSIGRSLVKKA